MRATLRLTLLAVLAACNGETTTTAAYAVNGNDLVALERATIPAWTAGRRETLAELDPMFARTLAAEYASPVATAAGHQRVVRAAMVHWARLVREALPTEMHTAVPKLDDDLDCRGSLVGDAVLLDYSDAAFGNGLRVEGVVDALGALARHMACLGTLQAQQLASRMANAFVDVRITLELNGLDSVIPYFVQAVAGPMLIVHDVERQHGPEAPLARWFLQYEALLVEGATTKHQPASWHGTWLYDRMTGRLRGFRTRGEIADENQIDLGALFSTVARPAPGDGACSLAEMVQRGLSGGRYSCNGTICADSRDPMCLAPGAGDSVPERGGGVSIPGLGTSVEIDCVSAQSAGPNDKQLSCLIEATGLRSDPRSMATKGMQTTTLAGVKVGGACTVSESQSERDYKRRMKSADSTYQASYEALQTQLSGLIDSLQAYQKIRDEVFLNTKTDDPARIEPQADVDKAEEALNRFNGSMPAKVAALAAQRAADIAFAEAEYAAAAKREAEAAAKAAEAGSVSGSGSEEEEERGYCEAGSRSCGNGCSAMQSQAKGALDCVTQETNPRTTDPMGGPRGCGGVCDPVDPATGSGISCTKQLEVTPGSAMSEQCWAVRCGTSDHGGGGTQCCSGTNGLTTSGQPQFNGMCGNINCGDSAPSFVNGKCSCGASSAVTPGTIVIPKF